MARRLKPQKVDEVRDDTLGLSADIMLNRNDLTFFAKLGDEEVTGASAKEVKNEMYARLRLLSSLEWKGVIEVNLGRSDGLEVTAKRYWYAVNARNEVIAAEWRDSTDELRLKHGHRMYWDHARMGRFEPPMKARPQYHGDSARANYLPYSEDLWTGIAAVQTQIKALRAHLEDLIMTPDGASELQRIGADQLSRLLPSTTGA
jgi:hypothetical protein